MSDFDDYNEDEWGNIGKPEDFQKTNKQIAWSKEKREALRKAHSTRVKTPEGIFESIKKCAKHYNMTNEGVKYRCKVREDWIILDKKEYQQAKSKTARETRLDRRPVVTPFGEYSCKNDFESDTTLFLLYRSFKHKCNQMPHLYYYKEDGPGKPTFEMMFITPDGIENIAKAVYDKYFESYPTYTRGYNGQPERPDTNPIVWWRKVIKKFPEVFQYEKRERVEWNLYNKKHARQ